MITNTNYDRCLITNMNYDKRLITNMNYDKCLNTNMNYIFLLDKKNSSSFSIRFPQIAKFPVLIVRKKKNY